VTSNLSLKLNRMVNSQPILMRWAILYFTPTPIGKFTVNTPSAGAGAKVNPIPPNI